MPHRAAVPSATPLPNDDGPESSSMGLVQQVSHVCLVILGALPAPDCFRRNSVQHLGLQPKRSSRVGELCDLEEA